jgi:hypothetical protein
MVSRGMLEGDMTVDFSKTNGSRPVAYLRDGEGLTLTASGREALLDLGVEVPAGNRVRCCIDWTEQRHHLSGAHGRALLSRFIDLGWLRRAEAGRAVSLTDAGVAGFRHEFGISTPDL